LIFGHTTLPYGDWRFSLGVSDREEGYFMVGPSVGRKFGDYFAGLGVYYVEDSKWAYGVMLGRAASETQQGPSFWIFHVNNPDYRRYNVLVAIGKPGIPKEAFDNPYADGMYTALFTDQMGEVLPIAVRSFEEMRVWKRPDEFAQAGGFGQGGLALSLDAIHTDGDYKILQAGLYYTVEQCGPLLVPHIGPVVESETLPGLGTQDLRYGIDFGTYLLPRRPSPFFRGGIIYLGVTALSDFDDYSSILGQVRINL
jgi:hypothetical protein